jgi:N-alpha-acetyltransferase 40, natD catalytic subunit
MPRVRKSVESMNDLKRKLSQIKIDAANAVEDFTNYIKPELNIIKINEEEFEIKYLKKENLDDETIQWMLNLVRKNMMKMYINSDWGWNEVSKVDELTEPSARFFLILNQLKEKIGFVHFRFEWDENRVKCVLYCYEIQIESNYQRRGIGAAVMKILHHLARKFKMFKVMLTCFKHNKEALKFYKKQLKYHNDISCPSKFNQEACYEILSLNIL